MLSTKAIVSILVAVVVVVGGFMFLRNNSNDTDQVAEEINTTENSAKKMAFSEFMKQGGSYKCTVNQNISGTDTVGTIYMDGGMMRGEYRTNMQGMSIDSYLIVRDGYTYTWSSASPKNGFKMKIDTNASGNTSTETSGSYSFNAEQVGDYNCEAWNASAATFALPAGVTFMTMSEMTY